MAFRLIRVQEVRIRFAWVDGCKRAPWRGVAREPGNGIWSRRAGVKHDKAEYDGNGYGAEKANAI